MVGSVSTAEGIRIERSNPQFHWFLQGEPSARGANVATLEDSSEAEMTGEPDIRARLGVA